LIGDLVFSVARHERLGIRTENPVMAEAREQARVRSGILLNDGNRTPIAGEIFIYSITWQAFGFKERGSVNPLAGLSSTPHF
jgi:hypothetical protein